VTKYVCDGKGVCVCVYATTPYLYFY